MKRGFECVSNEFRKTNVDIVTLPIRSDSQSAGYDFFSNETINLAPYESHVFWTDVKSYMQHDEVLQLYIRSSLGIKGLRLMNQTGIIDASYFENPKNDGNIGICIQNHKETPMLIREGERIAQGIFSKYLVADSDETLYDERSGGFGSSGK